MGFPAVAYNDIDGSGFLGSDMPWIIADFDTIAEVFDKAAELTRLGYKNATVFDHPEDDERGGELDELSWEYVHTHEIKAALKEADGCECCVGDEALYWKDDENNAFVDSKGEVFVTVKDHIIRFQVKCCPNCGHKFE